MSNIQIIVPKHAEGKLVDLTEYLADKLGLNGGYGLGGENGYGAEYENDTFMMHPFCWCEEDTCKWCSHDEPNFIYKPTGYRVWWYKWIGRSQRSEGNVPKDWLEQCKQSVRSPEGHHEEVKDAEMDS